MTTMTSETVVCQMTSRAQRVLTAHGYPSHVDAQGRLWATYIWSTSDHIGETSEVITNLTTNGLQAWLGY